MIHLIKKSLVLFVPSTLGIIGLIIFSFLFWQTDPSSKNNFDSEKKVIPQQTKQFQPSQHFLDLEYRINQTAIKDKQKFKDQISEIDNKFEKGYLSALLNKRETKYQSAYNLLVKLFDLDILYYPSYEELVDLANITGNLNELNRQLIKKLPQNLNLKYIEGLISYKKGNYKNAIKSFEDLVSYNKKSKEIYFWLSYFYRGEGNYDYSLALLDKADSLTKKEDIYQCKIPLAKGSLYYFSGDYDKAEKFYKIGYKEAKSTRNTIEEIRGLANIAIILDETGDVEGARKNLHSAIEKAVPLENAVLLAYLYSELGVSYTYTNEIIEARRNYQASYSFYSKLNNRERLSYLSTNIGSIYLQITNYRSALNYYQQAYEFAGENILGKILSLTGLADVYTNMANYSKALEYYHKAGDLADSIKDVSSKAKVDVGLGSLFFNISKPNSSLRYLHEAEKILEPGKYPYEASDILYRIGIVETSLKNYNKAEIYFKKGLTITDEYEDIYTNLAIKTEYAYNLYLRKNYTGAEQLLNDAKKTSTKYQLEQLLGLQNLYLGKVYISKNQNHLAIEKLKKAYDLGLETNDFNNQIETAYTLANFYRNINSNANAEMWYKKAIGIIEKVSVPLFSNQDIHIAHFSGFNNIYNSMIEFYLENNNTKDAFNILEKSRSRNTLQNIVTLKLFSSDENKKNLDRYLDLKWILRSNLLENDQLDSVRNEVDKLENRFKIKNKKIRNQLTRDPALTIDSIQSRIKKDEWIISVFSAKNFTQVFSINKTKYSSEKVNIIKDTLLSLINDVTPVFDSTSLSNEIYVNEDLFSFNAKSAYNLYKTLFKNTFDKINDNQKIIFSLPPELLTVPLEFLTTSWDDSQSPYYYSNKHFLIEKYPISYTPSASVYIRQEEIKPTNLTQVLLIGNPDIKNDDFTSNYRGGMLEDNFYASRDIKLFPLEFSRTEIENIEKLFSNDLVLLADDATETNFKKNASNSKIIHLSSHSFLYKNRPLILLTPGNDKQNDGFLEMGEIVNMNLHTDLVVLSSCKSGLGKIDKGEGIIGMQKSFFDAGASSIIVSLWDVNDKYTSYFMEKFYKYLSEGLDKNQALRKTKLSFIKEYSANPYYWSAFVLSGNISAINLKTRLSDPLYYFLGMLIVISSIIIFRFWNGKYHKFKIEKFK